MTGQVAFTTFINIAFAIAIWFAIPIVMPAAAALGWVLIVLNFLFSLGIAVSISQAYKTTQE
jgi:hypothetical protein